jgi:PAS domain S-box-containing protein
MKTPLSTRAPFEAILESISEGVFTVDLQWRITFFNRAAEAITGISKSNALGQRCSDIFRSSLCADNCALKETLHTGKPIIGKSAYIINFQGNRVPISLTTAQLFDSDGNLIGAAETFRDITEVESLRNQLMGMYSFGEISSRSPFMHRLFEVLPAIASSPSTVLIFGETGTGKELMAKTIHSMSPRNRGPFVAVNCGALPDTLLESELFGYKTGAFTGANRDKPGRFALAKGGTLFLDEIGDVSPALQVRLLRVLQERIYEPLGSVKPEIADVRVIAATSKYLAEMIKKGEFREDLYYRLNVVPIELPPLRKRREDIPLIVDKFIQKFNALQGRQIKGIDPEALSLLMAHDWPGNIRELENVIERSFILCAGDYIGISHLPEELRSCKVYSGVLGGLRYFRDLHESEAIIEALKNHDHNHSQAAKALGIHRTTLFRKMKKLGIQINPP